MEHVLDQALVEAKSIYVSRQQKKILQNVSLKVNERDFITIIGPNGAGKSMLLSCLMGFYTPNQGEVIRKEGVKIGYVPQAFQVEQTLPMSVSRFLRLTNSKSKFDASQEEIEEIYDQTNIRDLIHRPISVLSGGEMQRVLVARALIQKPNLLILDEPAQNMDVAGQLTFYKLIDSIYQKKNISILMVSHELHLVMASTKKVVCLYKHICCSGEPQIVMKDPEFISLFGDDMAKMMAVYQHQHDHSHQH